MSSTAAELFRDVDTHLKNTKMEIVNASFVIHTYETYLDSKANLVPTLKGLTVLSPVADAQALQIDNELLNLRVLLEHNKLNLEIASKAYHAAHLEWDGHNDPDATEEEN